MIYDVALAVIPVYTIRSLTRYTHESPTRLGKKSLAFLLLLLLPILPLLHPSSISKIIEQECRKKWMLDLFEKKRAGK
jgi:hypothetical protein